MSVIKIYQGKSKPAKKKPGWQKTQQEYEQWLKSTESITLFGSSKPKMRTSTKRIDPVVRGPIVAEDRLSKIPSLVTSGGAGTKQVLRPELTYKDDPELLRRELLARQRKFNVAPAYNKGGDQLVTEEQLKSVLSTNRRRP